MRLQILIMVVSLASLVPFTTAKAQEAMRVERCSAIDQENPIRNIYVAKDNKKYVSTKRGVFVVYALDLAKKLNVPVEQKSLLEFKQGNAELFWSTKEIESIIPDLKGDNHITAAVYDQAKKEFWVGTAFYGVFQIKTGSTLSLIKNHTQSNSKLRSDEINTLALGENGTIYIGTSDGLVYGKGAKWSVDLKFANVQSVKPGLTAIWLLADDEIWKKNGSSEAELFDVNRNFLDADIRDITEDLDGNLWIASGIITKYYPELDRYQKFGTAHYYTSQFANYITVDNDGAVWVGTEDKGLYQIEKESAMTVNCFIENQLNCNSKAPTAQLSVKITGGESPYTYKWNKNLQGANPTNLGPGEYAVTVSDSKGKSRSATVLIENPAFQAHVVMDREESPDGSGDGAATVHVEGNKTPVKYRWDNGETTQSATKLSEGRHSVTIADESGCKEIAHIDVVRKIGDLVASLEQIKEIRCNGEATATMKVKVVGGKGPYNYGWNPEGLIPENLSSLRAGKYALTVTDVNGARHSTALTINEPSAIEISTKSAKPASANGKDGIAEVSVKGGVGSYTYEWDNGESTVKASRLDAGAHVVSITDSNGCGIEYKVDIDENISGLSVQLEQDKTVKCSGEAEASIKAIPSGGKSPYTYHWNTAQGNGRDANKLKAGSYGVTIVDAANQSAKAEIVVKEPQVLDASVTVISAASTNTSDGKAKVQVKGGTEAYTIHWASGESTERADRLSAGSQAVSVTDANGCHISETFDLTENILALSVRITETQSIDCHGESGGTLKAEVSGGKPPFKYTWNEGSGATELLSGIKAGSHSLTVEDASGQIKSTNFQLQEPESLMVDVRIKSPASTGKSDGKASASVKGGLGAYAYKWESGEIQVDASGLSPKTQLLKVTDANGCQASVEFEIQENIFALRASLTVEKVIKCHGQTTGTLKVGIEGGKPPFKYSWNTGGNQGDRAENLGAGEYEVTVTDVTKQSSVASVVLKQPESLQIGLGEKRAATYSDSQDGKASVTVNGGTTPYSYSWDNGETGSEAQTLGIGSHFVFVEDKNGCKERIDFDIKKKILPELSLSQLRSGQSVQMKQLQFEADSATITASSLAVIDELYEFLNDNPYVVVEVGGHTNNIPPPEFCDKLSTKRAKAVADYITAKGIDPKRVYSKGYGKRKPIASNKTPEGRKKNQRVEIKILKVDAG